MLGETAAAGLAAAAQEIQHETRAVSIEIPVRVFKGNAFVDHLNVYDCSKVSDGASAIAIACWRAASVRPL